MDHGKIVSEAWNITWNNRVLWGLGFLAALAGSVSSGGSSGFNASSFNVDSPNILSPEYADGPLGKLVDSLDSGTFDPQSIAALFAGAAIIFCGLFILGIILWFVAQAARAGMIKSVAGLQEGQKISFGEAFRGGGAYIGRIFGMKFVLFFSVAALMLAVVALAVMVGVSSDSPAMIIVIVPFLCLFALGIIPLQFVDALAYRGIVLKEMGVTESLKHGWRTFRDDFSDWFILGILYLVINMVIGLVIAMVVGLLAFLSAGPFVTFLQTGELSAGTLIPALLSGLIITVVGAFIRSIVVAWQSTGFTLAYQRLVGLSAPPPKEKAPEDIGYDEMI